MTETTTFDRKGDVYERITGQIIAAIEIGVRQCEMPWHRDGAQSIPTNVFTGNAYNGVNILALWAAAQLSGYGSGLWGTFKQWRLLGGRVRKGEKGSVVVFYKETEREVVNEESGEMEPQTFLFARASYVFNVDQVDGWRPMNSREVSDPAHVLEHAEAFAVATGADVREGGTRAYYAPVTDHIQMPDRDRFVGTKTSSATESYYAVLFHELTHWTGAKKRLDRDLSKRFGDEAYAMEELVAELGAAFLCSDLGVTNRPREDHAAYISHWLEVLKRDKRAVFTAASRASEARAFLTSLQASQ